MKFLLARLREPSTLAGLGVLAALFGLPPDTIAMGSQVIAAVAGVAAVLLPEAKP